MIISDFVDDGLAQRHLDTCDECRRIAAEAHILWMRLWFMANKISNHTRESLDHV